MICFEYFSFSSFLSCFFQHEKFRKLLSINKYSIYFIDSTLIVKWLLIPVMTFFGKKVTKLNFKLMEIKDENGELVRFRIPRVDLFEFQRKIIASEAYKKLYHKNWGQDCIINYIYKGIIDGDIIDALSVSRILYLFEVLHWYMQKKNYKQLLFIVNNRPWLEIYKKITANYNIDLLEANNLRFKFSDIKAFIRNHHWIYGILKNLKYRKKIGSLNNIDSSLPKLYLEGRGDVNIENDGLHSDFFWQFNSDFPKKNIIYKYYSDTEKKCLNQYGITAVPEGVIMDTSFKRNYLTPSITPLTKFQEESSKISFLISSYDLDRFYWSSFFKFYNVKLFLSWNKYSNDHIATLDAINDNGGISVIWQMAFDGFKFAGNVFNADIYFSYSKFSFILEKKLQSKIKYNVIVGYPKDYAPPLLKEQAVSLRKKLIDNGAKKIIFVIDENSINDVRWHTGNELQQENYSFVLEKVLEISWLGVIFKPKNAKTLRQRLGSVADLLTKAEKTGRCFIYEKTGRSTTMASPVLAGLSSDICIYSHLSGGTAALECALAGLPTLLINREGVLISKLNELPLGKVVFKEWTTTIKAVMEHFNKPDGIEGFGDWSSIINDLDPFRDGKAAYRMGTYLHWLIQGYNQGLDKETIMFQAAERYKKIWGKDKVITSEKIYEEI